MTERPSVMEAFKNTQQRVLSASIIIIHQQTNLVFGVVRLLGQRAVAGRDYGVVKKKSFFFLI